jgi:type VI secretion system protein
MILGAKLFQRMAVAALVATALAAAFTGCPKKGGEIEVRVQVSPEANGGNPVAVDLLLVSNKELLKELQKMTAAEWFEKRAQFILDHPKEGELWVGRWEWVPGQVVRLDDVKVAPKVRAAVIFANYFNPGEHRAVLDPRRDVTITLGESRLEVSQPKR